MRILRKTLWKLFFNSGFKKTKTIQSLGDHIEGRYVSGKVYLKVHLEVLLPLGFPDPLNKPRSLLFSISKNKNRTTLDSGNPQHPKDLYELPSVFSFSWLKTFYAQNQSKKFTTREDKEGEGKGGKEQS